MKDSEKLSLLLSVGIGWFFIILILQIQTQTVNIITTASLWSGFIPALAYLIKKCRE